MTRPRGSLSSSLLRFLVTSALVSARLSCVQGKVEIIDLIGRAFANATLLAKNMTPLTKLADGLDSAHFIQEMPSYSTPLLMDVFELFGVLLFPVSPTPSGPSSTQAEAFLTVVVARLHFPSCPGEEVKGAAN